MVITCFQAVQKPNIEPFLSRCIAAVKSSASSSISPPSLRASSKVRDSSQRSAPLASMPQEEEEALERELETWIWTQQQKMLQRPSTPQIHHVKSSSSVNSSISANSSISSNSHISSSSTSSIPSHTFSLPLPSKTRRSQLNMNNIPINNNTSLSDKHNSINNNTFLPRQLSHPTPASYKSAKEVSLIDSDPTDGEVVWNDSMLTLSTPGSVLYNTLSSSHIPTSTTLTFPRSMTHPSILTITIMIIIVFSFVHFHLYSLMCLSCTSSIHYYSQSLPRKFPTIPAIKPIAPEHDPLKSHKISPHVMSARRKSIIPDPEKETSALYSSDENGVEFVLGGTLPQLVNSLTDERADIGFIDEFLYTYRYFTSPDRFLDHLQKRYLYSAPLISTPEEKAQYDEWRGPVQLRVITVLKKWIEEHFYDYEDHVLLDRLRSFIFVTISMQNPLWATSLEEIIHEQLICSMNSGERAVATNGMDSLEVFCALLKQSGLIKTRKWHLKTYKNCFSGAEAVDWMMMHHVGLKSRQLVCNLGSRLIAKELIYCASKDKNEFRDTAHSFYQFTIKAEEILSRVLPATPILPKSNTELTLVSVDPREIARQLTLIEFDLFKRIKIHEISQQAWTKNSGQDSPNVISMIDRFNKVGYWVASEVVSQKQQTSRVSLVKKLIKIAHICKKANNFNTMMEIAVGLNMGPVARLAKLWSAIDTKSKFRFEQIMQLTHSMSNYKHYREALKNATCPALPYLGLYLRDLTFIEDGNSSYVVSESEINFMKMRMLAKVFKSVAEYQQSNYMYTHVPQLQHYLLEEITILNETELYKQSYQCEPLSRNSVKLSASVS